MGPKRRKRGGAAKTARFELRLTPAERSGLRTAAEADGLDASTWARRVLRAAADERLARSADEDEHEPTQAEIDAALAARGSISAAAARHMRGVLRRAREEWR